MKKAKYLILILILVLTGTLLAGCTTKNSAIGSGEPATATDSSESTGTDAEAANSAEDEATATDISADEGSLSTIPEGYFTRVGNDMVSVAIPIVWKGKYYAVIDENIVTLYQKQALYKGVGRLCGFEVYTDDSYKELPWGYDIVAQDGDRTLIVHYPSDVQADTEDETSMKEYNEMYKMISQIVKTAEMKN